RKRTRCSCMPPRRCITASRFGSRGPGERKAMSKLMSPCDFVAGLARGSRAVAPMVAAVLALLTGGRLLAADPTDLSPVPLPTFTVKSEAEVMPNIMMVLDDSGSMDWDYLPDWAGSRPNN